MSTPTLDQQSATPLVPSSTAPSSPGTIGWVRVAGLVIGASATLAVVGLASGTVTATVIGVVLGVATSFVLASREMGDKRVPGGPDE